MLLALSQQLQLLPFNEVLPLPSDTVRYREPDRGKGFAGSHSPKPHCFSPFCPCQTLEVSAPHPEPHSRPSTHPFRTEPLKVTASFPTLREPFSQRSPTHTIPKSNQVSSSISEALHTADQTFPATLPSLAHGLPRLLQFLPVPPVVASLDPPVGPECGKAWGAVLRTRLLCTCLLSGDAVTLTAVPHHLP